MKQDEIPIGSLIRNKLEEEGHSVRWLAQKIDCKRRNVYDIFNRTSIDTTQLLKICLALKTNFFVYFSEKMTDQTEYAEFKKCNMIPLDEIHIGSLIKKTLEEDERFVKWLAEKIGCQPRNIYDIFKNRISIDTAQLLSICKALKTNFFECFVMYCDKKLRSNSFEITIFDF